MKLLFCLLSCFTLIFVQLNGETNDFTAASLKSVIKIIQTLKTATDVWKVVKDLPPTLSDKLLTVFAKKTNQSKIDGHDTKAENGTTVPISAYDFVVDLTRPTDIYGQLNAYPISFPLGKKVYDNKTKGENKRQSRFMVNVVGRYNVGKTYVLRLLANLNLGHSFVERTNGISVSLPTPKTKNDPNIALIDTAGSRTPVAYDSKVFPTLAYERQISDAFIQEIALNSSEIFLLVINQLTLDDQLYLKMLHKRFREKNINDREIKQRLLIVHNYFNLRTVEEVEKTAKYELGQLFGATQQHEGHWLSKDFKHFILANSESEAGRAYNDHTVDQLLTMIKASNAMQVDNVLEHIMYQIELLLKKFLEEKPLHQNENTHENLFPSVPTKLTAKPDNQQEVEVTRKIQVDIELEIKQLSVEELGLEPLWFICPKKPLFENITLSKNLKFNEDGSVYIDYSSQFIPDIHIGEANDYGDIKLVIECPSCETSSIKVNLRGSTLIIQGEKLNNKMTKEYLNTRRNGIFELEVPVGRLNDDKTFDYQKIKTDFQNGVITIIVPVARDSTDIDNKSNDNNKNKRSWFWPW